MVIGFLRAQPKLLTLPLSALSAGLAGLVLSGLPVRAQAPLNPEIKVGIVQRFGADPNQQIVLEPLAGDQLTVKFKTGEQPQTLTTDRVTLDISMVPLEQPMLQEWVVLSTHRSFESAEDAANRWQAAGIDTEVAQPNSWQVWAKRDVYSTPLLRRLLLENLQAADHPNLYIDSRVVTEVPSMAFIANGYRYNRTQFDIVSANRRIQLAEGENGRRQLYAGDLRVQPNAYGTYTVVNQVPIELYLRGVVPHEIGAAAPRTAAEAQTILARTYALRNLRRFAIDNYQLCADTQCQVYRGLSGTSPAADSAITNTQGQVLTYNNELVDALYSSTTGGITARFSDVWEGRDRPYLQPVVDSVQTNWDLVLRPLSDETHLRSFIGLQQGFNEDDWPTFRWQRRGTLEELTAGIKAYLSNRQHPLANLTKVTQLTVTERSETGRAQTVLVETDVGSFELTKNEIVSALIPPRSLLFYLEPIYEAPSSPAPPAAGSMPGTVPSPAPVLKGYTFVGGGFGHGVGLSQTGAYRLGELGWSPSRILQFYYPGTEIQPISPELTFWRPIQPSDAPSPARG
ncbi:MAG: SpoIID/LytB domain-containing protein [Leptolyngbya sp. SIO4C1]|nr:SpoIID/LytB domain-containing protein [Leptolyngbya sp. SIO4C1]